MTPGNLHDFFAAGVGAAATLIGLLFVAVSVRTDRLTETGKTQLHRVRANAALTTLTNALAVSLFALIGGHDLGYTTAIVAVIGVLFVAGALLSLLRVRGLRRTDAHDLGFLIGLVAILMTQAVYGVTVIVHPRDGGAARAIATLVSLCFLFGVSRCWEVIGGPSIGLGHEVQARLGARDRDVDAGPDLRTEEKPDVA